MVAGVERSEAFARRLLADPINVDGVSRVGIMVDGHRGELKSVSLSIDLIGPEAERILALSAMPDEDA